MSPYSKRHSHSIVLVKVGEIKILRGPSVKFSNMALQLSNLTYLLFHCFNAK